MAWNESLEALKGLVAEAAQAAARVTKSAASVTKSNISILTEQDKQKKAYLELGKLYYRDFITGEEPDDAEYLPLCETITETAKNIEALRAELEEAKASFGKPEPAREPEAPAESPDLEAELENLHKELDELEQDLSKLDGVEEKAEEVKEAVEAVFEVVDDAPAAPEAPAEEPKAEE